MSAVRSAWAGDSLHVDLAGVSFGLRKVIFHLKAKPYCCAAAESLGKSYGHFRINSSFLVHKVIEDLASHTNAFRGFRHGQANGSMHSWRTMRPGWGVFFMRTTQAPFYFIFGAKISGNQSNQSRVRRRLRDEK
jgi:hypothetical protein